MGGMTDSFRPAAASEAPACDGAAVRSARVQFIDEDERCGEVCHALEAGQAFAGEARDDRGRSSRETRRGRDRRGHRAGARCPRGSATGDRLIERRRRRARRSALPSAPDRSERDRAAARSPRRSSLCTGRDRARGCGDAPLLGVGPCRSTRMAPLGRERRLTCSLRRTGCRLRPCSRGARRQDTNCRRGRRSRRAGSVRPNPRSAPNARPNPPRRRSRRTRRRPK